MYFAGYKRLIYLAQTDNPKLTAAAEKAADYLGLEFKRIFTGYGELESSLNIQSIKWQPAA